MSDKPDTADTPETPRRRGIRSFVLRTGRLTAGQKRALEEHWPDWGIDGGSAPLDLPAEFGRDAPVVLEVGFGNGDNLVAMAAADPDSGYLGIEVHEPGVGHCLLGVAKQQLSNVRVMRDDAVDVLRQRIADGSLSRVNVFFPDPWHKKRHNKRRIIQPAFVELVARKLCDGGILHIVTDWSNYAEHIEEVMADAANFVPTDAPTDRITTRFDTRGQRLGHENWERAWSKQ